MAGEKWYGVATKSSYMVSTEWGEVEKFLQVRSGTEIHAKFKGEQEALDFGKSQFRILSGREAIISTHGMLLDGPADKPGNGVVTAGPECVPPEYGADTADDSPPW